MASPVMFTNDSSKVVAGKTLKPSKTVPQEWYFLRHFLIEGVGDMGRRRVPLTRQHIYAILSQVSSLALLLGCAVCRHFWAKPTEIPFLTSAAQGRNHRSQRQRSEIFLWTEGPTEGVRNQVMVTSTSCCHPLSHHLLDLVIRTGTLECMSLT